MAPAMKPGFKTIDEYIEGFPENIQEILQEIRTVIKREAPGAEETIKYSMPTFTLNGNLVHFAAYKKHIGLYPAPAGSETFEEKISVYREGMGSLRFPIDKPMPYDLIAEVVRLRVSEKL